ncbi:hypothetical protein MMC20_004284 [Loxospora ochrophaea]|nr:hypothetical protein [Loxospora ochrophaea]
MDSHPHLYLTGAFIGGIALTLCYQQLRRQSDQSQPLLSTSPITKEPADTKISSLGDPRSECILIDEVAIPEGIESCIGRTPLFKIKSLSKETGCEILAKAEFLNGAGGTPKDRVALNIITMVNQREAPIMSSSI